LRPGSLAKVELFSVRIPRGQVFPFHKAKTYFCAKPPFRGELRRRLKAVTAVEWHVEVRVPDGVIAVSTTAAARLSADELARAQAAVEEVLASVRQDAPFLLDVDKPDSADVKAAREAHGVTFFKPPGGKQVWICYFAGNEAGRDALKQALLREATAATVTAVAAGGGSAATRPPSPPGRAFVVTVQAGQNFGVRVCVREDAGAGPVLVVEAVTPHGVAASLGVRVGDAVAAMNGHAVRSVPDFMVKNRERPLTVRCDARALAID